MQLDGMCIAIRRTACRNQTGDKLQMNEYSKSVNYLRFVKDRILEAMADTRVIMLCGPRQSGKTTLAQEIASEQNIPYLSLDDPVVLDAALADPVGFIRGHDRVVIDEIHHAPKLILVIKKSVDDDPRPGRFLLTGSANLMKVDSLTDSLAGRQETINLLPLAQSELHAIRPSVLESAFAGEVVQPDKLVIGNDLNEVVLSGGFPEALNRASWRRRQSWHLQYIEAIIQRDIPYVAQVDLMHAMPGLIRVLAAHSGKIVNYSRIGSSLGLNHTTTQRYVKIFENLFVIRNLQPCYTNNLKRLIKTPKLHFYDAGLLAALLSITPESVARQRQLMGPVLESFVVGELLKIASWNVENFMFSHYRDKDGNEVDVVIEDRYNRVIGIKVKASATVTRKDFSGLHRLASAYGDNFITGLVLFDHNQIIPFTDKMFAAPISILWA